DAAPGGNSACAAFCRQVFSPGPARGQCVSDAAHREGPCYGGLGSGCRSAPCCAGTGAACSAGFDCCGGGCQNGLCCHISGAYCADGSVCCSGTCLGSGFDAACA